MTKEWLRAHCKKHGLYGTPSLNEKLFLHYQGFGCIQNLEDYIGLKTIFLEGNGLECLNGLERCRNLRCLFAQQNMIHRIPPTLACASDRLDRRATRSALLPVAYQRYQAAAARVQADSGCYATKAHESRPEHRSARVGHAHSAQPNFSQQWWLRRQRG